jgi:hypothetical protein
MHSHKIVDRQYHPTVATLVEPEYPKEPGIVDAANCECGLPELCCDHYCSIESCEWMVY